MNIAIVDDEKVELETAEIFLRVYIKKFWANYESRIHIETFSTAHDFLYFFCPKFYHVIILGSRMKNIAKFIRLHGDNVKIIFINSREDFLCISQSLTTISPN